MFGNSPLTRLPCAGSLVVQFCLPAQESCGGKREVHFGIGSTSEVREDLQNHRMQEKIRLAGTSSTPNSL